MKETRETKENKEEKIISRKGKKEMKIITDKKEGNKKGGKSNSNTCRTFSVLKEVLCGRL